MIHLRNVPIGPDTTDEQVNATGLFDFRLVRAALELQVRCVAVQNVHVLRSNVDMLKRFSRINVWYDSGWSSGRPTYSSILNVRTNSKLTCPSWCSRTSSAYMPSGVLPVGRPAFERTTLLVHLGNFLPTFKNRRNSFVVIT